MEEGIPGPPKVVVKSNEELEFLLSQVTAPVLDEQIWLLPALSTPLACAPSISSHYLFLDQRSSSSSTPAFSLSSTLVLGMQLIAEVKGMRKKEKEESNKAAAYCFFHWDTRKKIKTKEKITPIKAICTICLPWWDLFNLPSDNAKGHGVLTNSGGHRWAIQHLSRPCAGEYANFL